MLVEEEMVRDLLRQMHTTAENAPWPVSAEDIRARRPRRTRQMPNPTVLVLVAAAIIVLVVVLVGVSIGTAGHKSHPLAVPPASTSTAPPLRTTTTTTHEPSRVTVPVLVGEGQAQAESSLANAGLTVSQIQRAQSSSVAAGIVISQMPSPDSVVAAGSSVAITVSSGPSPTTANGGAVSSNAPVRTVPSSSVPPTVPTNSSVTRTAQTSLQVSVTSVVSVLTPYPPWGGYNAGIPAEEVSFTVTGMIPSGQFTCSVEVLQNGAVVGSTVMGGGETPSTTVATYTTRTDVSPLSVPTFDGTPSNARVTCDA
jgi:hypothetical protein